MQLLVEYKEILETMVLDPIVDSNIGDYLKFRSDFDNYFCPS